MLKVCEWQSDPKTKVLLVNIRDYVESRGEFRAKEGGRGIALTQKVWKNFYENVEAVNKDVEAFLSGRDPTLE